MRKRSNWKYKLKHEYGLTMKQREEMGNVCNLCGSTKPLSRHKWLSVDHNHLTGKVRGILCYKCNLAMGWANADKGIEILERALEYVKNSHHNS